MPFPWKKVKSTRISQLVNDHLHKSQKRRDGSSLVVATGFPTSLIDLIIKNREKLKKQSKRRSQNPDSDGDDQSIRDSPLSSASPPPPPPPPPPSIAGSPLCPPPPPPSIAGTPISAITPLPLPVSSVSEISIVGDESESGHERGADVNWVFWGVLKMFIVVVFALGAKGLTVGVTLSAFLLLFLEFVGKYLCRFSNKGVFSSIRFKKIKLDENRGVILMKNKGYPDQEIRVVDEIQPVNEITEEPCFEEQGLGCQEFELMDKELVSDVLEHKRKSRRAKIKSKMKKLVPKKFKISRKDISVKSTTGQCESSRKENTLQTAKSVLYEDQCEGELEFSSESSSSISGGRCREDNGTVESRRLSGVSEEEDDRKREEKVLVSEGGLTWKHLVLCLIVLIGLIGGRGFALALTLLWFLVLKFGEMLRRYVVKVPMIKSCNGKSC